jgi:hypothetical protein
MLDLSPIRIAMRNELFNASALTLDQLRTQNELTDSPETSPAGAIWVREVMTPVSEVLNAYNNQQVLWITTYEVCGLAGDGIEGIEAMQVAIGNVFLPGLWIRTVPDCPFHVFRTERGPLSSSTPTQPWVRAAVNVSCRAHYNVPVTP